MAKQNLVTGQAPGKKNSTDDLARRSLSVARLYLELCQVEPGTVTVVTPDDLDTGESSGWTTPIRCKMRLCGHSVSEVDSGALSLALALLGMEQESTFVEEVADAGHWCVVVMLAPGQAVFVEVFQSAINAVGGVC